MSNSDDLRAINNYVNSDRSQPSPGAPVTVINERNRLVFKWTSWYPGVISSWFVSDGDLANGKAIRNAIMTNNDPAGKRWVDAVAADRPEGAMKSDEKPVAPKKTKTPWKDQPLTYPKASTPKASQDVVAKAASKAAADIKKANGAAKPVTKVEEKKVETPPIVKAGFFGFWDKLPLWGKAVAVVSAAVGVSVAGNKIITRDYPD